MWTSGKNYFKEFFFINVPGQTMTILLTNNPFHNLCFKGSAVHTMEDKAKLVDSDQAGYYQMTSRKTDKISCHSGQGL